MRHGTQARLCRARQHLGRCACPPAARLERVRNRQADPCLRPRHRDNRGRARPRFDRSGGLWHFGTRLTGWARGGSEQTTLDTTKPRTSGGRCGASRCDGPWPRPVGSDPERPRCATARDRRTAGRVDRKGMGAPARRTGARTRRMAWDPATSPGGGRVPLPRRYAVQPFLAAAIAYESSANGAERGRTGATAGATLVERCACIPADLVVRCSSEGPGRVPPACPKPSEPAPAALVRDHPGEAVYPPQGLPHPVGATGRRRPSTPPPLTAAGSPRLPAGSRGACAAPPAGR